MNDPISAVIRISRFSHGEGSAEGSDALISMADIALSALCNISEFTAAAWVPAAELQ